MVVAVFLPADVVFALDAVTVVAALAVVVALP